MIQVIRYLLQLYFHQTSHFFYIFSMSKTALALLSILLAAGAKQFTQSDVVAYLTSHQMIDPTCSPSTFDTKDGKYIISFESQHSQQKFVLDADSSDNLEVILMQKSSTYRYNSEQSMPHAISLLPKISLQKQTIGNSANPFEMIPFPVPALESFNLPLALGSPADRNQNQKNFQLEKDQLINILFEELPILEGGEVQKIEKQGYSMWKGLSLRFLVQKDGKLYEILGRYRPRKQKLLIEKVQEVKKIEIEPSINLAMGLVSDLMKLVPLQNNDESFDFSQYLHRETISDDEREEKQIDDKVISSDTEQGQELIHEKGQIVGQNPTIESSAAQSARSEQQSEQIEKPSLKDLRL